MGGDGTAILGFIVLLVITATAWMILWTVLLGVLGVLAAALVILSPFIIKGFREGWREHRS